MSGEDVLSPSEDTGRSGRYPSFSARPFSRTELSTFLALAQLWDILAVDVTDKKELITSQRSYEVGKFRAGPC